MREGFRIFIPGTPAPQGSKRHVGKGIMVESSQRVKPWRDLIVTMCFEKIRDERESLADPAPTFVGPVEVWLGFTFPRPKSHYRANGQLRDAAPNHPRTGGDIDKLCRAVCDALGLKHGAGVIADDADVVWLRAVKRYPSKDNPVGCDITVTAARDFGGVA